MSKSWEYANYVQRVQRHGGPAAYDRMLREVGYNAGFVDGKATGIKQGLLAIAPFVLVSYGYLAYEKLPVLWRKIKAKIYYNTRLEIMEEEQKPKKRHLNLEPVCSNCGKKASGIDEVIKIFGFDRAEDGTLTQRTICKECGCELNQ